MKVLIILKTINYTCGIYAIKMLYKYIAVFSCFSVFIVQDWINYVTRMIIDHKNQWHYLNSHRQKQNYSSNKMISEKENYQEQN